MKKGASMAMATTISTRGLIQAVNRAFPRVDLEAGRDIAGGGNAHLVAGTVHRTATTTVDSYHIDGVIRDSASRGGAYSVSVDITQNASGYVEFRAGKCGCKRYETTREAIVSLSGDADMTSAMTMVFDPDPVAAGDVFGAQRYSDASADIGIDLQIPTCPHIAALCMMYAWFPTMFATEQSMLAPKVQHRQTSSLLRNLINDEASRRNAMQRRNREEAMRALESVTALKNKANDAGVDLRSLARKKTGVVTPTAGSVHLTPILKTKTADDGRWTLSLRISCEGASYVVQSMDDLLALVRAGSYGSYGKRLSFAHDRALFDAYSRRVLDYLELVKNTRIQSRMGAYTYYSSGSAMFSNGLLQREVTLSDSEVCDLLDESGAMPVTRVPQEWRFLPSYADGKDLLDLARDHGAANLEAIESQARAVSRRSIAEDASERHGDAASVPQADGDGADARIDDADAETDGTDAEACEGRIDVMLAKGLDWRMVSVPIFEGDPAMFFDVQAVTPSGPVPVPQTGTAFGDEVPSALGVTIDSDTRVMSMIHSAHSAYALVQSPQTVGVPAFFRCSRDFAAVKDDLAALCTGPSQYISRADCATFASTIAPRLRRAGILLTVPQLRQPRQPRAANLAPAGFDIYLDRTNDGITCEIVARYPTHSVQVLPVSGTVHADVASDSTRAGKGRDTLGEGMILRIVEQLFPARDAKGLALIPESDEDSIAFLMRFGLEQLRKVGTLYCTPSFDGTMPKAAGPVHFGVSIHSGLLEVMTMLDEIPSSEVGKLLASYRQRKRYHKLSNGTLVDLRSASTADSLSKLDKVSDALGLSAADLSGTVTLPMSQALVADAFFDETEKDQSFRDYVHDLEVIDPGRYQVPADLSGTMRSYQVEGYQWLSTLYDKGFGGILADEMGLGKTIQTLALALARRADGPALVVCPASLVYNWEAECSRFVPTMSVQVAAGTKAQRRTILSGTRDGDDRPDIVITSYDLLRRDIDDYDGVRFNLMVLDEAQYIKNPTTKIAKAVKKVAAAHRFALTGTPIENRLGELWSIFDFLMPGMLRSYPTFRSRYEMPIVKHLEDGDMDCEEARRLRSITRVFIKRRLKSQVLRDLPERLETTVTVRLEGVQRKLYAAHEHKLLGLLTNETGSIDVSVLAELTRLREICCDARLVYEDAPASSSKLDAIVQLVQQGLDADRRILVFSQFTSFLDLIAKRFDAEGIDHVSLVGSTPKKRRVELADDFNAGKGAPVMLVSLKAGNTGLNLVGASIVIHADPWWNVAAQNQATGRAHRIGQTRDVDVYQIVAADTVEERVHDLQARKAELANAFAAGDSDDSPIRADMDTSIGALTREDVLHLLS